MNRNLLVLVPFLLICLFISCNNNNQQVDLSKIKIETKYYPFYQDFSKLDTVNLQQNLIALKSKYPHFLDFYLDTLVGLNVNQSYTGTASSIEFNKKNTALKSFLTYKDYRNLFDTVNIVFPNTASIDKELDKLFKHVKYYDSTFYVPKNVYYFVSGLNKFTAVIQNENNFGIGLDMFLGKGFSPYRSIGIPDYALIKFTKENIPIWASSAIFEDKYPFLNENKTLLDLIIEKGKEMYFIDEVLPDVPKNLKFGYTEEQMKWAKDNEAQVYNYFLQNKLVYEKNHQKIMRYVADEPTTPGFPDGSPGNLGSYIGLRIIEEYAKNTKASLKEVLSENNSQKLLTTANYKP